MRVFANILRGASKQSSAPTAAQWLLTCAVGGPFTLLLLKNTHVIAERERGVETIRFGTVHSSGHNMFNLEHVDYHRCSQRV